MTTDKIRVSLHTGPPPERTDDAPKWSGAEAFTAITNASGNTLAFAIWDGATGETLASGHRESPDDEFVMDDEPQPFVLKISPTNDEKPRSSL